MGTKFTSSRVVFKTHSFSQSVTKNASIWDLKPTFCKTNPPLPEGERLLSVDAEGVVGPGLSDAEWLRGWSHVTTAAAAAVPALPSQATPRDNRVQPGPAELVLFKFNFFVEISRHSYYGD